MFASQEIPLPSPYPDKFLHISRKEAFIRSLTTVPFVTSKEVKGEEEGSITNRTYASTGLSKH
jgi:hypothetical protein